ncbi:OmpH family outer membrane protein [Pedobacter sp. SD-b]|uniref:OmpH family outer membrane protein n=1 Tax=Pedobacter segetis TaxID=2793069 RepID=A0ABS1BPW1_9SPHI|nr:OmpH family outer membrane protein [Pedobacter segetis]MBK0384429.1 OmpH family outer membrane protein [Pedobacter segetis]
MKKYIGICILLVIASVSVKAQRLAFVDSEYVLQHIPEYSSAQKQLNAMSEKWQSEINDKFAEVDKMQKDYEADKVLLTDDMRKKREGDILQKENEAKNLQQKRFGFEGDLYKEKLRLIKPIQERIGKTIEEYANKENIDMILDKSSVNLLFGRANFNVTNDIIIKLGYKPGTFAN